MQQCLKCRLEKPLTEYYPGKDRRCKDCHRSKSREWAAANRKRAAEKAKAWREANPERARAAIRACVAANPKKYSENQRRWRQANLEHVNKVNRAWRERNPDKVRAAQARGWAKRNRLQASAPGGPFSPYRPDYAQRVALYFGMCAYCEKRPGTELDHGIPLSRGGGNWPANIYPACVPCNRRKHAKKLWSEWAPPKAR